MTVEVRNAGDNAVLYVRFAAEALRDVVELDAPIDMDKMLEAIERFTDAYGAIVRTIRQRQRTTDVVDLTAGV